MIDVVKKQLGAFTPANEAEANGEIMGRCNALHDFLMASTRPYPYTFNEDVKMVCILMGFTDVLEANQAYEDAHNNEKASGASAD